MSFRVQRYVILWKYKTFYAILSSFLTLLPLRMGTKKQEPQCLRFLQKKMISLCSGVIAPSHLGRGAALRRGGGYSSGNLPLIIFDSYSFPDMIFEITTMSPTLTSPSWFTSPRTPPPVPPTLISFVATSESI